MSITFAAPLADGPDVFRLTCEVLGVLGEFVGHANAYGEAEAHALVCTDHLCQGYGADVEPIHPDGLDPVNVNNRDGADLLAALGLLRTVPTFGALDPIGVEASMVDDLSGEIDAASLLDRIDTALCVGIDDDGLTTVAIGNHVDVGRPAGKIRRKLVELRDLAAACDRCGTVVVWH